MSSRRFAENTTVSVATTKTEIEATLRRYGATQFISGWSEDTVAMVGFTMANRQIKFLLPLPRKDEFWETDSGRRRTSDEAAEKAWEQACRSRWRALGLAIKAKLEAVAVGISTIEDEFLANIVLPNNTLVRDHTGPAIERAYKSGLMPPSLLPALPAPKEKTP
jgi:hypothetical protein